MAEHDYIRLLDAVLLATTSQLACELVHVVTPHTDEMLVSVTTDDADATIAIIEPGRPGSLLLNEREQSGPDRWDYPLHREGLREQFALIVSRAGQSATVACAPVAIAHLAHFGWRDLTGDPIPVVVSAGELQGAIDSVRKACGADRCSA